MGWGKGADWEVQTGRHTAYGDGRCSKASTGDSAQKATQGARWLWTHGGSTL